MLRKLKATLRYLIKSIEEKITVVTCELIVFKV